MIGRTSAGGVDISAKTLSQGQLCAGGKPGKATCKGDSGGPLLVAKNDGFLYLAGLTSWEQGCAQPNLPGIFTRVPSYAKALNAIMDGKSSTLNAQPDATAVLPDSGETNSQPETGNGNGTETEPNNTPTGGGSGDGGSGGGGALSIASLTLPLLRRRKRQP